MIIKIALGILLGVIFLIAAVVFAAVICTGIVRMQDRITQEAEPVRIRRDRIRPEEDNYRHMQELKRRARAAHPERWEEEDDEN